MYLRLVSTMISQQALRTHYTEILPSALLQGLITLAQQVTKKQAGPPPPVDEMYLWKCTV